MIKPTHHYRGSKPLKHCTHIKISYTIDEECFEVIINSLLQEIEDNLYILKSSPKFFNNKSDRLLKEEQITRKMVEKSIRMSFLHYGDEGCDRESSKTGIEGRKDKINLLKERLFPDWFGSNSLKFINEK